MKPSLATKTQLSPFDTSISECGNSYRAGDWVKLRRKPRIAASVKRGDIFEINAVHPKDGSMRFWNPHINQWDFLYPEEVKLTLPPKAEFVVGEVVKETVQSVVGEVAQETVQSVVGEVVKEIVQSVVGEVVKETVQSVVGEVVKETVHPKNYWNSNEGYTGNGWLESHYKVRVDGKQRSVNCPETRCTGPYSSYRWMDNKRQRSRYVSATKYMAVDRALKSGKSVSQILEIISNL